MSAVVIGGVAPQHSADDQRYLAEFAKITNEYTTDPKACQQSIKAALPNDLLPQYYAFIYNLLAMVLISNVKDAPLVLTKELYSKLKLLKMPNTKPTPAEKLAMRDFTLAAFGILTLLGGEEILDTFTISPFIVGTIWEEVRSGVDKDGFVRKLLGAHARLVQADSVIWKAEFQATQKQAHDACKTREMFEEVTGIPLVLKKKRPKAKARARATSMANANGQASAAA